MRVKDRWMSMESWDYRIITLVSESKHSMVRELGS